MLKFALFLIFIFICYVYTCDTYITTGIMLTNRIFINFFTKDQTVKQWEV